jgi:predicted NBD/HSP70 family sugar kinase
LRIRGSTAPQKRAAIDALRYGPSAEVAKRSGTLRTLAETLGKTGWIAPCEKVASGGRESEWQLGPACGTVLSLSVGREELRTALAGPDGRLIAEKDDQLYVDPPRSKKQDGPDEFKELLVKQLRSCVARDHAPIVAVGVAWPSRVDPKLNSRRGDPHLRGYHGKWEGLDTHLFELVEQAMADAGLKGDIPVYVLNDADADLMALAHSTRDDQERYPGSEDYPGLAKIQALIVNSRVTLGVTIAGGVGGALMFAPGPSQRRSVQRGSHGFAGELGQIPVDVTSSTAEKPANVAELETFLELKGNPDFPKWDCRLYRETLDHYASGRSIVEQLYARLEGGYNGRIRKLETRLEMGDGDPELEQVMDRSGRLIGQALIGPTLTIDPDLVVISSFVWSKDLLEGAQNVLLDTGVALNGLERKHVVLAPSDPARSVKGAARWAIEQKIAPILERVCEPSNKDGKLEKLKAELLEKAIR